MSCAEQEAEGDAGMAGGPGLPSWSAAVMAGASCWAPRPVLNTAGTNPLSPLLPFFTVRETEAQGGCVLPPGPHG